MRIGWLILAVLGVLLVLHFQFPYAAARTDEQMRIVYLVAVIALMAGGGLAGGRLQRSQMLRDALLWLIIILVIAAGYTYRDQLRASRLFAALVPSRIQVNGEGVISVQSEQDGQFHIEAEINGAMERFLIDTGASDIVLSPRAAQDAGFAVETLKFTRTYQTANGVGAGAPVRLETLSVGPVTLRDVPASVNSADMDESLLGIAFLKQFRSYAVDGNTLTLIP